MAKPCPRWIVGVIQHQPADDPKKLKVWVRSFSPSMERALESQRTQFSDCTVVARLTVPYAESILSATRLTSQFGNQLESDYFEPPASLYPSIYADVAPSQILEYETPDPDNRQLPTIDASTLLTLITW